MLGSCFLFVDGTDESLLSDELVISGGLHEGNLVEVVYTIYLSFDLAIHVF